MNITNSIFYVGVNDHEVDLFEGQYIVPNGMAYNSYVICDEKIAVMDTVDIRFADEWLQKVVEVLDGKQPDYLIIQHMEPDHAGSIARFMEAYPQTAIVANEKTFTMIDQFFDLDSGIRRISVDNGPDRLRKWKSSPQPDIPVLQIMPQHESLFLSSH